MLAAILESSRKQVVTAVPRRSENGVFSFVLGGGVNNTLGN